MKFENLITPSGVTVPLAHYPADNPKSGFLMLPALGIQAKLYHPLAEALSKQGHYVLLMEQRGHGQSPLRASHRDQWGLDDILQEDIPLAYALLQERCPDVPAYLGGHSLGGHLATAFTGCNPNLVSGVVHIAAGFPYRRMYGGRAAFFLGMLCALIPLFRFYPGYFPGKQIGFAGRESVKLMQHWRHWALTGSFDVAQHKGLAESCSAFTGPVISVSIDRDHYASDSAVEYALSPFGNAQITRQHLGIDEQGEFLGHFHWARQPDGVVTALDQWMSNIPP